jgi:hypothetical protein
MSLLVVAGVLILQVGSIGSSRSVAQSAAQSDAAKIIGGWRLISILEKDQPTADRGPHPTGLTYYDATGHMALQIMPDLARPKWTGSPTPDQAKAAIAGYGAYFGTYRIDEKAKTLIHHQDGALIPGGVGRDMPVRMYAFPTPDRLVMTLGIRELTWERLK